MTLSFTPVNQPDVEKLRHLGRACRLLETRRGRFTAGAIQAIHQGETKLAVHKHVREFLVGYTNHTSFGSETTIDGHMLDLIMSGTMPSKYVWAAIMQSGIADFEDEEQHFKAAIDWSYSLLIDAFAVMGLHQTDEELAFLEWFMRKGGNIDVNTQMAAWIIQQFEAPLTMELESFERSMMAWVMETHINPHLRKALIEAVDRLKPS